MRRCTMRLDPSPSYFEKTKASISVYLIRVVGPLRSIVPKVKRFRDYTCECTLADSVASRAWIKFITYIYIRQLRFCRKATKTFYNFSNTFSASSLQKTVTKKDAMLSEASTRVFN